MELEYWDYFKTIEEDLIQTSRYVEICEENYKCYSLEFARLLITIGSELDMLLKQLCKLIVPLSKANKIEEYYNIIINKYPDIRIIKRIVRGYKLELIPFKEWEKNKPPE